MIAFREIDDADPALAFSPLVRGVDKTFAWISEHGSIPLTPSKAFKRVFVHWAAAEFDWPGHTEADLFAVNKVLNEPDFAPLMVLHDLMIAMKLGRHYKGVFRLTKTGQALTGHPGRIFGTVVPFFLFRINHASMSRFDDAPILGNWDVFLNVLNVEAEDGATGAQLEKRAKVGDALRGGISRRCRVAVNSLLRKGYATCQRLPSPNCPIHRDLAPTLSLTFCAMARAS